MLNPLSPVVGIDVGKHSSEMAILDAQNQFILKNYHIKHRRSSMLKALRQVQQAAKSFGQKPIVLIEATGHYYRILFYLFYNAGFPVALVNPIQTDAFTNAPKIRRAKTDKIDAQKIALFFRLGQLQPQKLPPEHRIRLKNRCRDYWHCVDGASDWKRRITALRDQLFLLFEEAFTNPFGATALKLMIEYPTPQQLLAEKPKVLATKIKRYSRKSLNWAQEKAKTLIQLAAESPSIPVDIATLLPRLQSFITIMQSFQQAAKVCLKEIQKLVENDPQYQLLRTIPGLGPITAATILAELGDPNWFSEAKKIVAFAGIDAITIQSGQFQIPQTRMSKRGSTFLRRALFLATIAALFPKRSRPQPPNPVLYAYYQNLRQRGKTHRAAVGACMRKMCGYVFAVLRDSKPFVILDPKMARYSEPSQIAKEQNTTSPPSIVATKKPIAFPVYDDNGRVVTYTNPFKSLGDILKPIYQELERKLKG